MTATTQNWKIGDCLELMRELDNDTVDLVVTDPPYGISMMSLGWDAVVPRVEIWRECLRILKPGAFAFIMSAPRQDVLAHNLVNLSDAGFETGFTSVYWTFSSGFPKSADVSKLVDKRFGAEREVIGESQRHGGGTSHIFEERGNPPITAPATPQANELDGSYTGFSPKPAVEVAMITMKPLSEGAYVDQALKNGKGITWLADGRIPLRDSGDIRGEGTRSGLAKDKFFTEGEPTNYFKRPNDQGRFPANLLVCDDVLNDGNTTHRSSSIRHNNNDAYNETGNRIFGKYNNINSPGPADSGSFSRYFDLDKWWDARIKHLPKEAQKTFPFMITPKASKSEKGENCAHPTVKPVKLFSWLITIGSREGDLVCDPFLGSGTTLEASRRTNRNCIGFELDPQWEHLYADRCMSHTPTLDSYF